MGMTLLTALETYFSSALFCCEGARPVQKARALNAGQPQLGRLKQLRTATDIWMVLWAHFLQQLGVAIACGLLLGESRRAEEFRGQNAQSSPELQAAKCSCP